MLGKFASSMQGFWWALDDQERKMILIAAAYLVAVVAAGMQARSREQLKQDIVRELRS